MPEHTGRTTPDISDPRLKEAVCDLLQPVTTLHTNPWFEVRNRGGYFTVEYAYPRVAILPVVEDRAIVLVRVRRPLIDDITWELPAGAAQPNERAADAAARELAEETGIFIPDTHRFRPLVPFAMAPDRDPGLGHIYFVSLQQSEFDRRRGYDEEIAEVSLIPFEPLRNMLVRGKIYVPLAAAIIGRFLLER